MTLTIVGIDPGTTAAFAVISLDGKLIHVASSRVHDTADLISQIIQHGRPLIVGCDKKVVPGTVAVLARKMGGRIVSPNEDLKRDDKRLLTQPWSSHIKNDHELDALAAALFAYGQYRELFLRVKRLLDKQGKIHLFSEVIAVMLSHEELNTSEAALVVEHREERQKMKQQDRHIIEKESHQPRKIIARLLAKDTEVEAVREENLILKARLQRLQRLFASSSRDDRIPQESMQRAAEQRTTALDAALKKSEQAFQDLRSFVAKISDTTLVVKQLRTLSGQELQEKAALRPELDAVLYVEHPDIRTAKVPLHVRIIITPHVPREGGGITYVAARQLSLEFLDDFVLVKKQELESALKEKNLLSEIVKEYKKERATR